MISRRTTERVCAGGGIVGTPADVDGTLACNAPGTGRRGGRFSINTTISRIATAASGSTCTGFSGSCSGMPCTLTVPENGDINVTANFAK